MKNTISRLSGLRNKSFFLKRPYHLVNIVLVLLITFVFLYAAFFPAEPNVTYPVSCIHKQITGITCPSCGLSRSFTAAIHGESALAKAINPAGFKLFLFCIVQLIFRVIVSLTISFTSIKIKTIALFDASISTGMFLYFYFPFIGYQLRVFNNL